MKTFLKIAAVVIVLMLCTILSAHRPCDGVV